MTKLGHEREGRAGQQHRDERSLGPSLFRGHGIAGRHLLCHITEERRLKQKGHQREKAGKDQKHGAQHQIILSLRRDIGPRQIIGKIQRLIEPVESNGEAAQMVGGEPVVRVQELHSPGRAVREVTVCGVPSGILSRGSEEGCPQFGLQKVVIHHFLVIPEVGELFIFGLQEQHVIELGSRVVDIVGEQFAALEHDRFRGDDKIPEVCCHCPAGPGPHGVSAHAHPVTVHIVLQRQPFVGIHTAAGGVQDGVSVVVLGIVVVKERQVGEVH